MKKGCWFLISTTSPLHPIHSLHFFALFCACGSSLQDDAQWLWAPAIYTLVWSPLTLTWNPVCYQQNVAEVTAWCSSLSHKWHYSFCLASRVTNSVGSLVPCHEDTQRPTWERTEVSCQKLASNGESCEQAIFKVNPPALGKPSNDRSPSCHFDCSLMWGPGHGPPR